MSTVLHTFHFHDLFAVIFSSLVSLLCAFYYTSYLEHFVQHFIYFAFGNICFICIIAIFIQLFIISLFYVFSFISLSLFSIFRYYVLACMGRKHLKNFYFMRNANAPNTISDDIEYLLI